jgi:hypothetical protein
VIFFRKAEEDAVRVFYVFGPSRKNLSRRLVIDKLSGTAQPCDGVADIMFRGAAHKILRLCFDGYWPDRGVYAM